MDKRKFDLWMRSTEEWKGAASVTRFMENEISGLRDADGDPLPDVVKQFFIDLLYLRIKPRRGRSLPRASIREQYKLRLGMLQNLPPPDGTSRRLSGDPSPSEIVKSELAAEFNTSVATIDQIVNPRPSRKRCKPCKP